MRRQLLEHWHPVDALARARNAWAALRQTGTVSEYTAQFRAVLLQVTDTCDGEVLDKYLRGLCTSVRVAVLM